MFRSKNKKSLNHSLQHSRLMTCICRPMFNHVKRQWLIVLYKLLFLLSAKILRSILSVVTCIFLCNTPSYLQLKELNHDNIKPFVGACIEPGHICYLMQCCSRGTVQVRLCSSLSVVPLLLTTFFTAASDNVFKLMIR